MEESTSIVQAEQQVIINVLNGQDSSLKIDDLVSPAHKILFKAAAELRSEGILPDLITITNRLEKKKLLDAAGGAEYVQDIYQTGRPVQSLEPHERIIREESTKRSLVIHAKNLLAKFEEGSSAADLLTMAQKEPMNLAISTRADDTVSVQDAVFQVLEELRDRRMGRQTVGVSTPFKKLNYITNGLQPGDLIIIAGRPSMGKTALGAQLATHVARNDGPVFIASLEMDKSSLIERMLAGEARVGGNKLRSGAISNNEMDRLKGAAEKFQDDHPILVNDTPRLTATDIRVEITKQHTRQGGLSLAVIDYLGLVESDERGQQRYRELGIATKILRATARELQIPVILLCQLNRECEHRENKRPILADLRESGDIEQDSDVVIMVYRDEYYCETCQKDGYCDQDHVGIAELLVRKQRKGKTGTAVLTFLKDFTMFADRTDGDFGQGYEPEESCMNVHPIEQHEIIEESPQQDLFKTHGYTNKDGEFVPFPNQAEKKNIDEIPF